MSSLSNENAGALLRGTHGLTEAVMNGTQGAEEVIASLADVATKSSAPDAELGSLSKVLHRVLADVHAGRLPSVHLVTALKGLIKSVAPVSSAAQAKPETRVEAMSREAIQSFPTQYVVTVDYDRSVEDVIRECGFIYVNSRIHGQFFPEPNSGRRDLTIEIVSLEKGARVATESVLSRLKASNLRPVTLRELLALRLQDPKPATGHSVVALGSNSLLRDDGYELVPSVNGGTDIDLLRNVQWFDWHFFAAVKDA